MMQASNMWHDEGLELLVFKVRMAFLHSWAYRGGCSLQGCWVGTLTVPNTKVCGGCCTARGL